jgi:hypothetical protein
MLALASCLSSIAQERAVTPPVDYNTLHQSILEQYGFDQVLVNGFLYTDKYWRKVGHQFLLGDQLYNGNLTFRGKTYQNIPMKYDLYDQQLVVNVKQDALSLLVALPEDFISDFSIENKRFTRCTFDDGPKFCQVVFESAELKCLYYWFKEKRDLNDRNYPGYCEFRESEKKNYLILNGVQKKYNNNKSFIELFPVEVNAKIRKYMKSNRIKVSRSSGEEMAGLLAYCITLL